MSLSETGQLSVVEDEGLTHLNSFGFQRNDSSTYRCADKLSSITGMALEAITATATKVCLLLPIFNVSHPLTSADSK